MSLEHRPAIATAPLRRDVRSERPAARFGDGQMRKALMLFSKFTKSEDGAALVEYTVLLGILLVAVIATIVAVGGWVNDHWTSLNTALAGH